MLDIKHAMLINTQLALFHLIFLRLVTNIQPLPDYIRWIRTKELHYMSLNERHIVKNGVWNDIAELFLPLLILEIVRKIIQTPPDDIMLLIALLAWVKPDEVKDI